MNSSKFPLFVLATLLVAGSVLIAQEKGSKSKALGSPDDETSKAEKSEASGKPKKVVRTAKEWREVLTREQFKVLRLKGTEAAFRNKYDKHFEAGTYACAACGQELFASSTKFNSGCGWPAFYAAQAGDRVILQPDYTHGMTRVEVICARCDSHLGHVFRDAPQTPTGNRFCINSVSLKFIPAKSAKKESTQKGKQSRSKNAKSSEGTRKRVN